MLYVVVKGFLRAHRAMRFRARKSPSCLGLGWYDLFMMNCLVPSRANWALGQLPHKVTNALTGKLGGPWEGLTPVVSVQGKSPHIRRTAHFLKAGDSFACEERIYQRPLCHFAGIGQHSVRTRRMATPLSGYRLPQVSPAQVT